MGSSRLIRSLEKNGSGDDHCLREFRDPGGSGVQHRGLRPGCVGVSWDQGMECVGNGRLRVAAGASRIGFLAGLGWMRSSITRGHKYESLVYDLDAGHGGSMFCDDRGQESLEAYYRQFSREEPGRGFKRSRWICGIPYIAATESAMCQKRKKKIVFDRFHVDEATCLEAVDEVSEGGGNRQFDVPRRASVERDESNLWLWGRENIPLWRKGRSFETLAGEETWKVCRAWAIKENFAASVGLPVRGIDAPSYFPAMVFLGHPFAIGADEESGQKR